MGERRAARWRAGLLIAGLSATAGAGEPQGWRHDGTGVFDDVDPPTSWSTTEGVCWKAPLSTKANASAVILDDLICVTEEPTTLACFDKATGAARWRRPSDYAHTLSGEARAAHEAEAARIEALEASLGERKRAFSRLQREARRSTGGDVAEQLAALSAEIDEAKAAVDAFDPYRTARPRSIMGYATETPITDGEAIYALFGQGVMSRFEPDGSRTWSVWLGPAPDRMRGFHTGTAASPLLVDDTLVVAYGRVRGLDPATGAVRWEGPAYPHYGTPGVATVQGQAAVVLPGGTALRASDGQPLVQGLGDVWFVGPHGREGQVWYVGGRSEGDVKNKGFVYATKHDVSGATPRALWATKVPARGAWYTAPVVYGGRWYGAAGGGTLHALSDADGSVLWSEDLKERLDRGLMYPSPVVAGGRLYVSSEKGVTVVLQPGDTYTELARNTLEPFRSTPVFEGDRMYVRGESALWCLGGE